MKKTFFLSFISIVCLIFARGYAQDDILLKNWSDSSEGRWISWSNDSENKSYDMDGGFEMLDFSNGAWEYSLKNPVAIKEISVIELDMDVTGKTGDITLILNMKCEGGSALYSYLVRQKGRRNVSIPLYMFRRTKSTGKELSSINDYSFGGFILYPAVKGSVSNVKIYSVNLIQEANRLKKTVLTYSEAEPEFKEWDEPLLGTWHSMSGAPDRVKWNEEKKAMSLDFAKGGLEFHSARSIPLKGFEGVEFDFTASLPEKSLDMVLLLADSQGTSYYHAPVMTTGKAQKVILPLGKFMRRKTTGTPSTTITKLSLSGFAFYCGSACSDGFKIDLSSVKLFSETKAIPYEGIDASIVRKVKTHPIHPPYVFAEHGTEKVIKLVAGGKSEYKIAAAKNIPSYIPEFLQIYIKKATGVTLPIIDTPSGKIIYIDSALSGYDRDAFLLEAKNAETISISASNPRSAYYGVCDFLEKALGIRFFMPFPEGCVVPKLSEVSLPVFRDLQVCAFKIRKSHYCCTRLNGMEQFFASNDWLFTNRYNTEQLNGWMPSLDNDYKKFYNERGGALNLVIGGCPSKNGGHNMFTLIPDKEYFKSNPEYFTYDKVQKKRIDHLSQLCTTNHDVARIIAEKADKYFTEHPGDNYFGIFQNDGPCLWCECPECEKLNPPGFIRREEGNSDRNINLCNNVAKELEKKWPDKKIITYAYNATRRPPKIVTPHRNVVVYYAVAPDSVSYPVSAQVVSELMEWEKLTNHQVLVYEYLYCIPTNMYTFDDRCVPRLRLYSTLGVQAIQPETAADWGDMAYVWYLTARYMWDPWLDEEAFRKDYFEKLYGAAAEVMDECHSLLRNSYKDQKNLKYIGYTNRIVLPKEIFVKLDELETRGRMLVKNDSRAAKAVERFGVVIDYYKAFCNAMDKQGDYSAGRINYTEVTAAMDEYEEMSKTAFNKLEAVSYFSSIENARFFKKFNKNGEERKKAISKGLEGYEVKKNLGLEKWLFSTDEKDAGVAEKWFDPGYDRSKWKNVNIGTPWESQGFPDYNGYGWYSREITVDAPDLKLLFLAVDEKAWVYLDGELIGSHAEGDIGKLWQEPFSIDIPAKFKAGTHLLVVRVHDSGGAGGIWQNAYIVRSKAGLR